jgi:hypothetical protein
LARFKKKKKTDKDDESVIGVQSKIKQLHIFMILYHYCDPTAFLNIIQSKKLWLSNLMNMSDYDERYWAERIMNEELSRLKDNYAPEVVQELYDQYNVQRFSPYICCFSTDGDLLSQWRAYADDGHGFAIGFDSEAIPYSKRLPMMAFSKETMLSLHSVEYNEEKQRNIIRQLIRAALERISIMRGHPEQAASEINQSQASDMATMLLRETAMDNLTGFATIAKNPAFAEEKEYRLIHMPMISANKFTNHTAAVQFATSELKYRISGKQISTYFEYDFSALIDKKFIIEVITGPKNQTSTPDLSMLLGQFKYKVKISNSRATYR